LVEKGADTNNENPKGETSLLYANMFGFEDNVKYLIEQGADVNKMNGIVTYCFMLVKMDMNFV